MAMPNCRCPSVSFISLVVLMVQNSLLVVLTRYSRISVPPEKRYHTSTLVLNQEIVKMLVCLVLLALEERSRATVLPHMTCRPLKSGFLVILKNVSICKEALELSVPALLYVLQNFLTFVGLSNLDAATFQVWSQTKLLFTALLSEVMLGRHLSSMQWMALVLLAFGVLLTQRQDAHQHHDTVTADQRPLRGIFACVVSGLSSSYPSVYFGKIG
uniref:Uncharacterized protein TCIL3000_10_11780 n=1 Tax=Trypanosoma congolense (strain IL3000) TaxID=1068625 RepID=G0UYD0_TRYCI|nr:unnamed protein product [Trypanosoma congolense IL3000]